MNAPERPQILLTFPPPARALYYGDKSLAALRQLGAVRLNDRAAALDTAALIDAAQGCEAIVCDRQTAVGSELFAACPRLAVVLRCAMDIRTIDVAAASAAGVLVMRASAGFGNAVAEWVLGVMIDSARGISRSVHAYRSGAPAPIVMGRELRGATLGIIGYGHIGRRLGAMARALGMALLVSDPQPPAEDGVAPLPLGELLAHCDFVVCLAPALPQTENLMNAARFAQMKAGATFINAARGELVDEAALHAALESGHLAGAALDVGRAPDQMPSPALAVHPSVIATPHIGGLTPAAVEHQASETVAQLAALLRGEMPTGAVNPTPATRLAAWRAAANGGRSA